MPKALRGFRGSRSLFEWPIEPRYAQLAHDMYLVSGGDKSVFGYTHCNGLLRKRHYVYIAGRNHYGYDITAAPGTAVRAPAAGAVLGVYKHSYERTATSGYGLYLVIDHGSELVGAANAFTIYGHLQQAEAKAGDRVSVGDVIAYSGNSGGSRIPHLHFEFRIGANDNEHNVDPLEALPPLDTLPMPETQPPIDTPLPGASHPGQVPCIQDGLDRSSVELYRRMLNSNWEYEVRAMTLADKTFDDGAVIPAGAELPLLSRSDEGFSASVSYNGSSYAYALDELAFIY